MLHSEIRKEIHESKFFAVEVDETTDISGHQQLTLILRYVNINHRDKYYEVKERFLGFSRVTQRNAEGLSTMIVENLKDFEMEKKLVNQTYDGAAVMSGEASGVQARIKAIAPMAHFIHCAAHRLNLTLRDSCMSIKPVKQFFGTLSNIQTFFSNSPKRLEHLDDIAASDKFRLARGSATRWNFKSRCVNIVTNRFEIFREFFDSVVNDTDFWDSATISSAHGFLRHFEDEDFAFLLLFFNHIFGHVDVLYNVLQSNTLDVAACERSIQKFVTLLSNTRSAHEIKTFLERAKQFVPFPSAKQRRHSFSCQEVAFQVIDTMKTETEIRFSDIAHLSGFSLIDNHRFAHFKRKFPSQLLDEIGKSYPLFDLAKLRSELETVYADPQFNVKQGVLLSFIIENGLVDVLSELFKLLLLYFTIPLTTSTAERSFSTLKRVKTYLRSTMSNQRLDSLSLISIEKKLLRKIDRERIIDHFASLKERRADFLYK